MRFFINILELVCETDITTSSNITNTNVRVFCWLIKQFAVGRKAFATFDCTETIQTDDAITFGKLVTPIARSKLILEYCLCSCF